MVLADRVGEHIARVEGMLLRATLQRGRLGFYTNELRVDHSNGILVNHGFGIEIKDGHEWRYLVFVSSPGCC